jgi:hypothetical protein
MNTPSSNGFERQPRGAVGNLAHFFRDLAALVELQGLLFVVDAGDEFRKARKWLMLILLSGVIAASCVPVALAGAALILAEQTRLTAGQSLLSVSVAVLILACGGIYIAAASAKIGDGWMQRSREEWRLNVTWIKETLKQI